MPQDNSQSILDQALGLVSSIPKAKTELRDDFMQAILPDALLPDELVNKQATDKAPMKTEEPKTLHGKKYDRRMKFNTAIERSQQKSTEEYPEWMKQAADAVLTPEQRRQKRQTHARINAAIITGISGLTAGSAMPVMAKGNFSSEDIIHPLFGGVVLPAAASSVGPLPGLGSMSHAQAAEMAAAGAIPGAGAGLLGSALGRKIFRGSNIGAMALGVPAYFGGMVAGTRAFGPGILGHKKESTEKQAVDPDFSFNGQTSREHVVSYEDELLKTPPLPTEEPFWYDEPNKPVMEKEAVSRWREAIYSGELPMDQREALKAHMGATPERFRKGLDRGSVNLASKKGVPIVEAYKNFFDTLSSGGLGSLTPADIQPLGHGSSSYANKIVHNPFLDSVGFASINMGDKQKPLMERLRNSANFLTESKNVSSLVRRHEVDEARIPRMKRSRESLFKSNDLVGDQLRKAKSKVGFGGFIAGGLLGRETIPDEFVPTIVNQIAEKGNLTQGTHTSPKILMNELRNSRMLSPRTQKAWGTVRNATNEFSSFPEKDLTALQIPPSTSQAGNQFAQRMQDHADAPLRELDKTYAQWSERGARFNPYVRKVTERAKGLLARLR